MEKALRLHFVPLRTGDRKYYFVRRSGEQFQDCQRLEKEEVVFMTGRMRIFLLLVIIVSMLTIETESAYACSCAPSGPLDEELTNAAAVFTGKVVGLAEPIGGFGPISSADPIKVTFQVYTVWKGSVSQTTTITTARSGASCGYTFEKGGEYIVYAHGPENNLSVSLCSRTQPLATTEDDLAALGVGAAPLADSFEWPASFSYVQIAVLLGTGIGMILFVIAVAVLIKRYSRS